MTNRMWVAHYALVFVVAAVGSGLAQNSQGGVFQTAYDYIIGANNWTWRNTNSPFIFEGSTDDAFETTFTITEPTADRTWTFGDVTTTAVGTDTTQTLTNKTFTSPTVTTPTVTSGTFTTPTINQPILTPDLTAGGSAITLTAAANAGHIIALDTAAGTTVTLPAATGSGVCFHFLVTVTPTSNQHRLAVVGDDEFVGVAWGANDTDASVSGWEAADAGDNDHFNMNSGTQGGEVGDYVTVCDLLADNWSIHAFLNQSGTEATPFNSAQVS